MVWRAIVVLFALAAAPPKPAAPALKVRSIDIPKRLVLVEVAGAKRVPAANLFTFTDDRGRHFVAVNARCQDASPSGIRACELEIPMGYERHPLVGVAVRLRGLKSKPIQADPAEVEAAWRAAVATGADGGV